MLKNKLFLSKLLKNFKILRNFLSFFRYNFDTFGYVFDIIFVFKCFEKGINY